MQTSHFPRCVYSVHPSIKGPDSAQAQGTLNNDRDHVTSVFHNIAPQVAPHIRRNTRLQDFPTNDKKKGVLAFQGQLCQVFQTAGG